MLQTKGIYEQEKIYTENVLMEDNDDEE